MCTAKLEASESTKALSLHKAAAQLACPPFSRLSPNLVLKGTCRDVASESLGDLQNPDTADISLALPIRLGIQCPLLDDGLALSQPL